MICLVACFKVWRGNILSTGTCNLTKKFWKAGRNTLSLSGQQAGNMSKTVLSEIIRLRRKSLGKTQAQVAAELGVSVRTYQRIEDAGELEEYRKLFEVLGLELVAIDKVRIL